MRRKKATYDIIAWAETRGRKVDESMVPKYWNLTIHEGVCLTLG
jgi:hypothetical protein